MSSQSERRVRWGIRIAIGAADPTAPATSNPGGDDMPESLAANMLRLYRQNSPLEMAEQAKDFRRLSDRDRDELLLDDHARQRGASAAGRRSDRSLQRY